MRLLILADHALVADMIRLALRGTPGFEIVGYVNANRRVGQAVAAGRPDIVLVDGMQKRDVCVAGIAEVARAAPAAKCLLLAPEMDRELISAALRAGADGVISKAVHPSSLGTLLREIARGHVVHSLPAAEESEARKPCPLTHRELEILRYVAEGHTNLRIARELWVTEQTVKFHLSNTYRKLGVSNRTEASRYAYLHALIPRRAEPAARQAS